MLRNSSIIRGRVDLFSLIKRIFEDCGGICIYTIIKSVTEKKMHDAISRCGCLVKSWRKKTGFC